MSALVYQAINAVAAELSELGLPKSHNNEDGNYHYRSIDDVMARLAPLLARHKLCLLPKILERTEREASGSIHVAVRAAFEMVSALDGSRHVIETFGEAIDGSDKATAKAISAAYKSAVLQAFCIPVPQEEADARSPRRIPLLAVPEPPGGWAVWVQETIAVLKSCESADAIDRLCELRRQNLGALQRANPTLYAEVGEVITRRLLELRPGPRAGATRQPKPPSTKKRRSNAIRETSEAA